MKLAGGLAFLFALVFPAFANSQESSHREIPEITNDLGMKMRLLPGGQFDMGKVSKAVFRKDHSEFNISDDFRHPVVLTRPFYLAATEVTRGQFAEFVKATKHQTTAESGAGMVGWDPSPSEEQPNHEQSFQHTTEFHWQNAGFDQTDDHPVVGVSFRDAIAFCEWLSQKENKHYRLPTEAEWEFAARAGTQTSFSFGDKYRGVIHQHANVGNIELEKIAPDRVLRQWIVTEDDPDDGNVFTAPVGSYKPNPFGLYDMHGNVWEWCQDVYLDTFYNEFKADGHHALRKRAIDPLNMEPANDHGDWRVIRGGCWYTSPIQARSGGRGLFEAEDAAAYVGFRVAMDADKETLRQAKERFDKSEAAREKLKSLTRELRERNKGILAIVVDNTHLTDEFYAAIQDLDCPVDLEVSPRGRLTGKDIENLVQVRDLRGLILSGTGTEITDTDIAPIATQIKLERLQITGTSSLSDKMMPYLSGLTKLQSLSLHGEGITDAGLAKLPDMPHIRRIHIPGTQGSGEVLRKVTGDHLHDFQCKHFRDDQFRLLAPHSDSMRTLHLSGEITDSGIKGIVALRRLHLLSLSECPKLTDAGLRVLGDLRQLEQLRLEGIAAGDETIDAIADNNFLRELQIGSVHLTDRGVMRLSECVSLRDLFIENPATQITDDGFIHYWRMRNLDDLRLVVPKVSGKLAEFLVECSNLRRLTIAGPAVNNEGIEKLARLKHVGTLNIGSRGGGPMKNVSEAGLRKLAALPKGVRLKINLNQVDLNYEFIEDFREAAPHLEISGQ